MFLEDFVEFALVELVLRRDLLLWIVCIFFCFIIGARIFAWFDWTVNTACANVKGVCGVKSFLMWLLDCYPFFNGGRIKLIFLSGDTGVVSSAARTLSNYELFL